MKKVEQLYFYWLLNKVCGRDEIVEYRLVFEQLFYKEFSWLLEMDENIACNGLDLRYDYVYGTPIGRKNKEFFDEEMGNCRILEVMVSLAMDMEAKIMSNSDYGDRTSDWFWDMMCSLGLNLYPDDLFDERKVDEILEKFLDRRYRSNGKGGLFTQKRAKFNSKDMEIWAQATNYLSDFIDEDGEIW